MCRGWEVEAIVEMKDKIVKIFVAIYVEAQAHSLYTVGTQNYGWIYSDIKDKLVIPHRSPKWPTHLRDPINCSRSWDKALRPGLYWQMCSVVPEAMPYSEWRRALPPKPPQAQKPNCLAFWLYCGHVTKAENSQLGGDYTLTAHLHIYWGTL